MGTFITDECNFTPLLEAMTLKGSESFQLMYEGRKSDRNNMCLKGTDHVVLRFTIWP